MVEMALILPVLVLVLVGILEFGLLFKTYIQVSYGASEISRAASLSASSSEITALKDNIFQDLNSGSLQVTITPATTVKGQPITVEVRYTYQLVTPIMSNLLSGNIVLRGRSVVIKE